jgi:hypothetical protein
LTFPTTGGEIAGQHGQKTTLLVSNAWPKILVNNSLLFKEKFIFPRTGNSDTGRVVETTGITKNRALKTRKAV